MTLPNVCVAAVLLAVTLPFLTSSRLPAGAKQPILIGLALRIGYAFSHAVIRTMPGLDKDARLFGYEAADIASGFRPMNSGSSNGGSYLNALGLLIRETGASANLLQLTSVITWLGATLLLVHLARRMQLSARGLRVALYMMALTPSSIMWTSGLMREGVEMLVVTVLFAVILHAQTRVRLVHVGALGLVGWLSRDVHAVMPAFAAVAATLVAVGALSGGIESTRTRRVAVIIALGLSLPVLMPFANSALSSDDNVTASSEVERRSSAVATTTSRAYYGTQVNLASPGGLLQDLPVALGRYLFTPFPWQVGTSVDLLALGEALVRMWVAAALLVTRARFRRPIQQWAPAALPWIVFSVFWAIGTSNFGTAMRHNVVTLPLLALCCGSILTVRDGLVATNSQDEEGRPKVASQERVRPI